MEQEISVVELRETLKGQSSISSRKEPLCLLDVREPWEAKLCALPGSRLIPMGDLPTRAKAELKPEAHIVVYCHHGVRSLGAVNWLREHGFQQAQSLAGGIEEWARLVDPTLARY